MCQRLPGSDTVFLTQKSEGPPAADEQLLTAQQPAQQRVVKVCTIEDEMKKTACLNEAKILKKLDCELINKLHDYYEDPDPINKAYLVLEYAGNQSLVEWIEEQKLAAQINQDESGPAISADLVKEIMT